MGIALDPMEALSTEQKPVLPPETGPEKPPKMSRKLTRNLRIIPFVVLMVMLAAEAGLRLAHVNYSSSGGKRMFYVPDEYTGVALRPGSQGSWDTENHLYDRINSQGLRDREHSIAKPANTFRIAVLGDSFTQAMQVPMDQDYSSVLERDLAGSPSMNGRNVEVINFGVSSFNTAQELLELRHRVWQYSPDLVILAFYAGNNIHKNSRALHHDPYRPYFVEKNGKLVLDDSFQHAPGFNSQFDGWERFESWVITKSYLLQAAAAAEYYFADGNINGLRGNSMGLDPELYREPTDPAWQQAWQVTEDLIVEMNNEVVAHGAKFLLVTLSSEIQVDPDPAVRRAFMQRLGMQDLFYSDHRIERLAEAKGIPALILAPAFQAYAEQHKVYLHGFRADHQGHWNRLGHQLAGQMIADKIATGSIVVSSASK